jgi:Flp pilus assembly pilin Flp
MLAVFRSFVRDTRGARLVDYSLIAAVAAVAGISALCAIGGKAAVTTTGLAGPLT